jgi:hypothetical protein
VLYSMLNSRQTHVRWMIEVKKPQEPKIASGVGVACLSSESHIVGQGNRCREEGTDALMISTSLCM